MGKAGPAMPLQEAGAVAIEQWAEEHKDAFKPPICNKGAGARRLPASRECVGVLSSPVAVMKKKWRRAA